MRTAVLIGVAALVMFSLAATAFCAEEEISQEKVIAIATEAVKDSGVSLEEVDIIYDEGGKIWDEKTGILVGEDKSPNHGILRKGFLKNYRVVYFDFKEPLKDIWVFVDKDTGEVLTVYKE